LSGYFFSSLLDPLMLSGKGSATVRLRKLQPKPLSGTGKRGYIEFCFGIWRGA
jgi:hypothetical protein